MKAALWVIVNKTGIVEAKPLVRKFRTLKPPTLTPDQRIVKVWIEVPDVVFREPTYEATVSIPEVLVGAPVVTVRADNASDDGGEVVAARPV